MPDTEIVGLAGQNMVLYKLTHTMKNFNFITDCTEIHTNDIIIHLDIFYFFIELHKYFIRLCVITTSYFC